VTKERDAWDAETDAEVERIMAMTDEEIIDDCWANGEDPNEVAKRIRALVLKAIQTAKRQVN
jgi:succinate dehydrogenase flavin-adding protein (antitoxin of CptAB toxin-antitoxin module)